MPSRTALELFFVLLACFCESAHGGALCSVLLHRAVPRLLRPPLAWLSGLAGCVSDEGGDGRPGACAIFADLLGNRSALSGVADAPGVTGVPPAVTDRYRPSETGSFQCLDGLRKVPIEAVNDDFCDCDDGSDEPGTSACASKPGTCFFCRNDLSSPKLVYSSQVGDGICDCCDGADESTTSGTVCPNTCAEEGAAAREARELRKASILEGMRILKESIQSAASEFDSWQAELNTIQGKLSELERVKNDMKARQDEAQAAVDAEKKAETAAKAEAAAAAATAAAAAETVVVAEGEQEVLFSEDFEDSKAIERWARAEGGSGRVVQDPKGSRGNVLGFAGCTWGGDIFSRDAFDCTPKRKCVVSFWARGAPWQGVSCASKRTEEDLVDAHSWLAVPVEHTEGFHDRLASTQSSDEWKHYQYEFPVSDTFQMFGSDEVRFSSRRVHLMLQAHASTGFCEETMLDDIRIWRSSAAAATNAPDVSGSGSEGADVGADARTAGDRDDAAKDGRPEVSEYAKWALEQQDGKAAATESAPEVENYNDDVRDSDQDGGNLDSEASKRLETAKQTARDASSSYREASQRKQALEDRLKYDLGEQRRWISLVDRCAKLQLEAYAYEVCFYRDAKQDHTSLGRFDGWDPVDRRVMRFTKGQHCHGGPERSLRVRFVCGARGGELLAVTEPSRCTYEAEVEHPGACEASDLAALEREARGAVLAPHGGEL